VPGRGCGSLDLDVTQREQHVTLRKWTLLFIAAATVSILALSLSTRLRLDTNIVDLFPDSPVAQDYRSFLDRFGGFEKIYVVVSTSEAVGSERDSEIAENLADAAEYLATLLEESEHIGSTRCGFTEEDERFMFEAVLPRAPLLLDEARLRKHLQGLDEEAVRTRVRDFKPRMSGPMFGLESRLIAADPLGFAGSLDLISRDSQQLPIDPVLEVFLSPDRRKVLVVATPSVAELDSTTGHQLTLELERAYQLVGQEHGDTLSFAAVGGPLYAALYETIIRRDLIRTVTGSSLLITLVLMLYFRGPRIPLSLVIAVVAGVLWTAAAFAITSGRLSLVGISFAAILIGLGIDYGIHGAQAFRAGLIEGHEPHNAMGRAFRKVGPAIIASAGTTSAAFLVLALARLGPVRELGYLVATGVLLILAASVSIGAALLVIQSSTRRARQILASPGLLWNSVGRFVERLTEISGKRRRRVLLAASVVTVMAAWGLARVEFDADLAGFRPIDLQVERTEQTLLKDFSLGSDGFNVVVQGSDLSEALVQAERAKQILHEAVGSAGSIVSPSDFLASDRPDAKRRALLEAALTPSTLSALRDEMSREGFNLAAFTPPLEVLDALASGADMLPVPYDSWPDWLQQLVYTEAGETFLAIQVTPGEGRWAGGPPQSLIDEIQRELPTAAVTAAPLLGRELEQLVSEEFRRLAGWCLLIIGIAVLLSFRGNLRFSFLALVPVVIGCVWLLGICGWIGIRINLFSVTAAPLLLGIGIDDGLHALHGVRAHGGLLRSIQRVGPAMTITTLTTCVGFGSLGLSRLPALRTGGLLIALGTLLCLVTSLVLLPALAGVLGRRAGGTAGQDDASST
jgi:predicted RND superfamily exporter protein